MVCHSLLQWTTFCQISPPWPAHLGWPLRASLSFIELDKALVRVIRLISFLWLWFQCVCPLMPSLNTYYLTWVSLTLDIGYFFTAAPAKHSCYSLLWRRVSPHRGPSWPVVGLLLWPQAWSSSSWPPSLASSSGAVWISAAAAAKSLQSCPTLCDPIDSSPPGSAVPGILQARTLEWVAISFSDAWMWKVNVKWLSRVRLLATPWTGANQVPPSMGFSRQE